MQFSEFILEIKMQLVQTPHLRFFNECSLLFADDAIVFCGASLDQVTNLFWLLMWFKAILGLKINLDKSEMILVGSVDNLEVLTSKINCKVGELQSFYLGLPLGPLTSQKWYGMRLKSGFAKGSFCGKDNTSLKGDKF